MSEDPTSERTISGQLRAALSYIQRYGNPPQGWADFYSLCSHAAAGLEEGAKQERLAKLGETLLNECRKELQLENGQGLLNAIKELKKHNQELQRVLKQHHDWHFQSGLRIVVGEGDTPESSFEAGEEYADSAMYERTVKVLNL